MRDISNTHHYELCLEKSNESMCFAFIYFTFQNENGTRAKQLFLVCGSLPAHTKIGNVFVFFFFFPQNYLKLTFF